jgi:hypothetical protein
MQSNADLSQCPRRVASNHRMVVRLHRRDQSRQAGRVPTLPRATAAFRRNIQTLARRIAVPRKASRYSS